MRINRLTDYAVVILANLAQDRSSSSAQTIAERSGVPLPTVAKLLKILGKSDLVDARRGASGGYALARKLEDISIAEVIQAVEGPISLTACVDTGDAPCELEAVCAVSGRWTDVNRAVQNVLDQVSLAQMAGLQPVAAPLVDMEGR